MNTRNGGIPVVHLCEFFFTFDVFERRTGYVVGDWFCDVNRVLSSSSSFIVPDSRIRMKSFVYPLRFFSFNFSFFLSITLFAFICHSVNL